MHKSIIIFGPTGVGKSDFSLDLAQAISGEIINMDIGQLYTPLTIGTAKPDWKKSTIRHHLFDLFDEPINCNAFLYRKMAIKKIDEITERGNIPIIVGGCSFYLRSLFFPLENNLPQDSAKEKLYSADTDLWHELQLIDPERASAINKNDIYRIKRALFIWHATGVKPSQVKTPYKPPTANTLLIYIDRQKEELDTTINNRVVSMIKQGWIEEVAALLGTEWETFLSRKKLIGYNELIFHLKNKEDTKDINALIEIIKQKTRYYAKKQKMFWTKIKKELSLIESCDKVEDIDCQKTQIYTINKSCVDDSTSHIEIIKTILNTYNNDS